MTPNFLRAQVIAERSAWIRDMLDKICSYQLGDVESLLNVLLEWVNEHPEKIDQSL